MFDQSFGTNQFTDNNSYWKLWNNSGKAIAIGTSESHFPLTNNKHKAILHQPFWEY